MATTTAKLALRKPDPTDNVNVTTDISDNMQKIDDAFAGIVAAYRNAIRNGDMQVRQRGLGPFTATGYTLDGWIKGHSGGTHQVDAINETLESVGGINGSPASLRSTVAAQAAVGDYANLSQRIEGVRTLSNKQVTLSFVAYASAGTPKIGVEVIQSFGTGGAPSADVTTAISAITLSTTGTKYSVTFTVPSIAGKTLGSNLNDYLMIALWYSAGSTWAARASNIGIQNATITITDVQLEAGSVATAFERLPQQVQLAWCQRYFYRAGGPNVPANTALAMLTNLNTVIAAGFLGFPVPMRVSPTATVGTAASLQILYVGGAGVSVGSIPTFVTNPLGTYFEPNASSAVLTSGQATIFRVQTPATGYIDFTAEL